MLSRPSLTILKKITAVTSGKTRCFTVPLTSAPSGSGRSFGSTGRFPERYFLVEYSFVQDAYYKRIPVRDEHLAALEKLKTTASAKLITAPLFPYTGSVFFISSEAEDPHAEVTKFVKDDPYVKAELVDSYRIREFAMTDQQTEFDRIASKFLVRS